MKVQLNTNQSCSYCANKKKERNVGKSIVSAAAGAVSVPLFYLGQLFCVDKMVKLNEGLSEKSIEQVNNAASKILNTSGLRKDGVKVFYVEQMSKGHFLSPARPENGRNSMFIPKKVLGYTLKKCGNLIVVPEKSLYTSIFHELGHAMTHNFSSFGRNVLQSPFLRGIPRSLAPYAAMLVLPFTSKRNENVMEEERKKAKMHNFMRDNAYLFMAGLSAVTILEEVLASLKGQKLAKGLLSKEAESIMKKTNLYSAGSYVLSSCLLTLPFYVVPRVKDLLVERSKNKNNNKKGVV